jgi:hypothetical protein
MKEIDPSQPDPLGYDDAVRNGVDNPWQLEFLYRQDPSRFASVLQGLLESAPGSILLRAWQARLSFDQNPRGSSIRPSWSDVTTVVVLAVMAGTFAKLLMLLDLPESYVARNLGFVVFPCLAVFFLLKNRLAKVHVIPIALLMAAAFAWVNVLPAPERSDTLMLAAIHLPFLLWCFTGLAFLSGSSPSLDGRTEYVRFTGEALPHIALIAVCGGVFTGLTFGLFSVLGVDIETWYQDWVLLYGMAGAPIVAAGIVHSRIGPRIAPILARIFGPLMLAMLAVYLVTMGVLQKSPYTDREFLIIFNAMLVAVLVITTLSIAERPAGGRRSVTDYVNVGLAAAGLTLDLIALSAIVFRLASYGFTPNRIAVLGANLLIFVHLGAVLVRYFRFLRGKSPIEEVDRYTARYLTVYAAWAAFITFLFPLIYRFA